VKWDGAIGDGFAGEGWTLRVPNTNVNALEVRQLSWWRTGVAVIGGAVITFLGFDILGAGSEGRSRGRDGGEQL